MALSRRMVSPVLTALCGALLIGFTLRLTRADDAPATKPADSKLVVKKAFYGDLPDGPKTDVTDKVSAMVKDNALTVEANNDNFGDPANGTVKKLKVDYTFEGKEKSKTVDEGETLTISNAGE